MGEKKLHYKMYKDGKKFVFAAISTLSFFVFGGVSTVAVHADTTSGNSTTTANSTVTGNPTNVAEPTATANPTNVYNQTFTANPTNVYNQTFTANPTNVYNQTFTADPTEPSSEYAKQALYDEQNAAQNNDFTAFDKKWAYAGTDLGFNYSQDSTTFKIWSPTATSVKLISYGTNTDPTAPQVSVTPMTRGTSATPNDHVTNTIGVWSLTVPGDQNGLVYAYELTFDNGTVNDYAGSTYGTLSTSPVTDITNDPYSIATTQGGNRSVVVSPASIASNLVLAQGKSATWRVASPTQAVIDELHVRDFTISPTSGVSAANRGKYLGVIESGTKDPNTGTATGLDYLKNEGFNYVQLMPVSQYSSVDESGNRTTDKPNNYNWGYDPQNEMVPEGEYATDSVNPVTRINEMKQMVQGLHQNGIGVIMDVVLNHVFDQSRSAFEKAEPGYYFRRYTQSGCGNDTASDHEMFSKFVIDSVMYWAKNYDIDGFRFDEMTLLDRNAMNKLRAELTAIDPHIIMYGEGWTDSNSNHIPETSINNAKKVSGIGFFNPSERDVIVNNGGSAGGFASGDTASTTTVASALLGSGGWNWNNALQDFWTPSQSVNYIECHDSYTVNDSLWSANPNDSVDTHRARLVFANAINILANGITFMEAGQEFGRTKLVNPSNLTPLSPTQTQSYQSGSIQKPAWYSASWDTAKNSYNGLFAVDSNGKYYGNYWPGSNLGTTIVAGDVVNGIDWDNVKDNQHDVNLISNLIKFKKSNPQFWPNDYRDISWHPTGTGVENVTNASNGVITEELTSGATKYLVVLNASGNSVTIGQGGQFYGNSNLTGKTVIISNDGGLTANQVLNSSVTLPNLTFTIIQISKSTAGTAPTTKNAPTMTTEKKTVNETVSYVDQNGHVVAQPHTASVDFTRQVSTDVVTGEKTYGPWSADQSFAAVKSPELKGYTADKAQIDKQTVNGDSKDLAFTVTYTKNAPTMTIEKKTVNETIHYQGAGNQTPADHTASVDFTRQVSTDAVTGEKTYGSWSADQSFAAVKSPELKGYTADKAQIDKQTVNEDSKDLEFKVTYTKNAPTMTTEKKTVNETVSYIDQNGHVVAQPHTASVDFTRQVSTDAVTGEKTYGPWSADQSFAVVKSPELKGYTADKAQIDKQAVNEDSKDLEFKVTYTKPPIADDVIASGNVGDPYSTTQKDVPGYTFKEVQGNPTGSFTDQDQTVTYVYTKNPATDNNGGTGLNQPAQPASAPARSVPVLVPSVAARVALVPLVTPAPAQPALPQTGRAHSLIALVGLAGLAAASMMSLAGVNKRKHKV